MTFSENKLLDVFGGLVCTSGGVVGILSVIPMAETWVWVFELPGHFRMQWAGCLLLASVIMRIYRKGIPAVLFLLGALFNASFFMSYLLPTPKPDPVQGTELHLVLFNVNSSIGQPEKVAEYLEAGSFDVVVLQEYSSRWAEEMAKLSYPHRLEAVREDNFGMAVFSRYPFTSSDVIYLTEEVVPSLRVTLAVGETPVQLLATHPVPPVRAAYVRSRNKQLGVLSTVREGEGAFLLVGDLNTTPWSSQVKEILARNGLKDSADGFGLHPTWPSGIPLLSTFLDHVFYAGMVPLEREVGPALGSDHRPVEVRFALP